MLARAAAPRCAGQAAGSARGAQGEAVQDPRRTALNTPTMTDQQHPPRDKQRQTPPQLSSLAAL